MKRHILVPLWRRADIIDNGHCCGCRDFPVTLYRVDMDVYRCAACYEAKTGNPPAFDPNDAVRYNAMPWGAP